MGVSPFTYHHCSSSVRTTRFSRSVTSKKLTDPRSKLFKTVRLMDDENEDEESPNSIELGVMSEPGCHSMPSTRCKNRDSESQEQTGRHHHAADE